MSEHTPGPWEWVKSCYLDGYSGLMNGEGTEVLYPDCCIYGDYGAAWFDEFPSEADARLIAAAPLLLEACKAAEEYMRRRMPEESRELVLVRAAIAAAEGDGQ